MPGQRKQRRSNRRNAGLRYRNDATGSERLRSFVIRPNTINEEARTVDAVLATEGVVSAFDVRRQRAVLEILLMNGGEWPNQLPLVDTHQASTIRNQFGSVRNLRVESGELVGTLHFSATADREWTMAKEGHLTDVSLGYYTTRSVEIPAGQTRTINNRSFTAPAGTPLYVATGWRSREVSLTSVGADARTKLRTDSPNSTEGSSMNPRLRAYLQSIGLNSEATPEQAQTFYDSLSGDARQRADAAASATAPAADPPAPPATPPTDPQRQRSATPPANPPAPPVNETPEQLELRIRTEAAAAERQRSARIQQLVVPGVSAEMVRQAIDEGWTVERSAEAFLTAMRDSRRDPPAAGAPAIHTRSHEGDATADVLGAAMMVRSGVALDSEIYRQRSQASVAMGMPNWLRLDVNHADRQRVMDTAHRFSQMSLPDLCRECVRMDGGVPNYAYDEMIRSAVSGSSLSAIFTTNVSAQLLAAYAEAMDTTMGWVSETDVANFLDDERASMGRFGALTKHARVADHMDVSDSKETSRIARYSGQFKVDEIDLINDRFGAIQQLSPADIGRSAAQLRPDLLYAILLANAALDADSTALFHSDHANAVTNALDAANLEAAIAAMAKQRIRNRPLNVRPRFLLVPHDLRFTAQKLLRSAARAEDSGQGTFNALAEVGVTPIADDRLGVAGVTDPASGTAYAGSATNWYLSARPGEGGAKTLVVKYRRGTGRAPQLRSFVLTQGTWGVGWDINHDIGADADDFRGLYRGNT